MFTCDQCAEDFPSKSRLKKHKVTHKKTNPVSDDTILINSQVHEQNNVRATFKCNLCEFIAAEPISLNLHMETHNHSCNSCSYKAIHIYDLQRHTRSMHPIQKNYSCKLCDFFSPNRDDFKEHCQLTHEKVHETRIFIRNFTPNRFSNSSECNKCSYRPVHQYDLTRHMKTMHQPTIHSSTRSTTVNTSTPSTATPQRATPSAETSFEATTTFSTHQFQCSGPCSALQKSFETREEYDLHVSYFHKTQ